jgi:hypothetical protein
LTNLFSRAQKYNDQNKKTRGIAARWEPGRASIDALAKRRQWKVSFGES